MAITPVVNAIRVLERMVPDGHLLFGHDSHDARGERPDTGSLKPAALRERIEDFTDWANREAARHGLPGPAIPADPHGPIGLVRFRRSLAWHIGCGNIARTDQQAAQLRERATALEIQAGHVPQPVGDRIRATAAKLRDQAGKHDRTRITAGRAEG